jgi:hypothetical protein
MNIRFQLVVLAALLLCIQLSLRTSCVPNLFEPVFTMDRSTESRKNATVPVFYNLFVANQADAPRVERLVQEQLDLLLPEHALFLHSIGHPLHIQSAKLLEHHAQGDEVETLRSLWEYCTIRPDSKVVYIHSKGSFHDRPENNALRRFLTTGALSRECLNLPSHCNVCASRMSPLPHPHVSGNMWLARCDYIQKLINPKHFEARLSTTPGLSNQKESPWCYGIGRFAAEHWVHSHPSVMPCDLSADEEFIWNYENIPLANFSKQMSMAPRFPLHMYEKTWMCTNGMTSQERITEYVHLYDEMPSETWWGWRLYNDTSTS